MPKGAKPLPPLEWIRVFESAGRTGSFTMAAAETGLTQAAVSQRIRNLESHIGAVLFHRQARGVSLTVEGEAWLPYVANALNALSRSTDELFAKPLKRIRILASTSLIQLWFAPRLKGVADGCQYAFHTLHTHADAARENAEVQVRFGPVEGGDVQNVQMFRDQLTPMAAPALLRAGAESWASLPLIAVSGPRPGWLEWAAVAGLDPLPLPQLRFDSFSQGLAAALAGAGVLLGSLPLCQSALTSGALVGLSDMALPATQSYYLTSRIGAVPQRQWQALSAAFGGENTA